jgi:parvulin-like peptidyl-prolyl isomerase
MSRYLSVSFFLVVIICQTAAPGAHGFTPSENPPPEAELLQIHAAPQLGTTIIAEVNGVPISLEMLVPLVRQVAATHKGDLTPELAAQVRREAVDKLIMEELAYQRARELGIRIEPEEIADRVNMLREKMGEKHYRTYVEMNGLREENLHLSTERFLSVRKALEQEVEAGIEIDPKVLAETYAQNKDQFIQPEKVQVTDVIFFLDPADPEALEKALLIRQQMVTAEKSEGALESDGTFIVQAGINLDAQRHPILHAAAKDLAVGEISTPIEDEGTLHLLRLTAYSPRVEKSYEEAEKLLARKIEDAIRRQRLDSWKKSLKEGAEIKIYEDAITKGR